MPSQRTQVAFAEMLTTLKRIDQVSVAWLSEVTGLAFNEISVQRLDSNWAEHARIKATLTSREERRFWLKLCLHPALLRSEVDYYTRDYIELTNPPIVACYHSAYEPGVGYLLLLEDVSEEFQDRKEAAPSLEHGLAIAEAVARMHRHYWETGAPRTASEWDPILDGLRPGITIMERETGRSLRPAFEELSLELRERWGNPLGQTLLHGDLNPTNVLTPKGKDKPVLFLDRQPLDGVATYGLATYDLAYATTPWWPLAFRGRHENEILRCWYDTLDQPTYQWEQALEDWRLSTAHCLHVPLQHCVTEESALRMSGLWRWQLENMIPVE